MSDISATQIFAISSIPVFLIVSYRYFGTGRIHGYTALIGGAFLLLGVSLLMGVLESAWGYVFSEPASCTVKEFFTLSGGLGCANIPVAACYSFIIYGTINLVVAYGRKAS